MSDSRSSDPGTLGTSDNGSAMFISSRLMIAAIAFFFAVVIFVTLLDLYFRLRWGNPSARSRGSRRNRLVFQADRDDVAAPRRGLPAEILKAIPVSIYRSSDLEDAEDCAVCLSELADGEKIRLLPHCHHNFHVDCIDMWFHSHSTCPLCRNLVDVADTSTATHEINLSTPRATSSNPSPSTEPSNPNGSMATMALVIEIPRRVLSSTLTSPVSSPLPSSRRVENMKSPSTIATPSRLRSFRRLMSREKRVATTSCSSPCDAGDDIEVGLMGGSTGSSSGSKTTHKNL